MAAEQKNQLELLVRSRQGLVFEGPVSSVSSKNAKGVFDILSGHANFIGLIDDALIVRGKDGRQQAIGVENGILKVAGNRIEVYLGVLKT